MKSELATRWLEKTHPGSQEHAPPSQPAPARAAPARRWFVFAGSVVLFAGWLGWLAYLAFTTRSAVQLSRPQFLVSAVDVVLHISSSEGADREALVREVPWSGSGTGEKLAGQRVVVKNLQDCAGWNGPGDYLAPLIPAGGEAAWLVPQTPRSPGFEPDPRTEAGRPRIYPLTPNIRQQYQTVAKP